MSAARDPRVDAFIARAPDFAQPILARLRADFHAGCPELRETIKWGVPFFEHKGLLGGMAVFKAHVSMGFWKSRLMPGFEQTFGRPGRASCMVARFATKADLPPKKVMTGFVREAKRLNEEGIQEPKRAAPARRPVVVPAELKKALAKSARARACFAELPPSHRRNYVEWITEAKRPETRARRLAAAVASLAAGSRRYWEFQK